MGKMTSFPNEPEYVRPILDEFLEALREKMERPEYKPAPGDRERWRAGAHKLYNNFNAYRPGFIKWAVDEHCRNFSGTRYIASPWSLRYLWDEYADATKKPPTEQWLDELRKSETN